MNKLFPDVGVGRKNVITGILIFLVMGVIIGIPLTIDFMGGSLLTGAQYQSWKVIHGYSVFLAFINLFLGLGIDHFNLPVRQKEIVSWAFLAAGIVGGLGRMALVLLAALESFGRFASLIETVLFVVGTIYLLVRQKQPAQAVR